MNKPVRNKMAKYRTVTQIMSDVNLCRGTVVRLAKEAGAYIHVGRSVRIDADKFLGYIEDEYTQI